jgi:hypothetical protein
MNPTSRRDTVTYLSVGTHLAPADGACLMEVVSRAAGETWSDSPTCTHPLLAHLARLVNDASSDPARQTLLAYVPALRAARTQDPGAYPRLALACTDYAMRHRATLWLAHLSHAAARQLRRTERSTTLGGRGVVALVRRRLFERGPAGRAAEAAVLTLSELPGSERDTALRELLEVGLRTVMEEAGSDENGRPG